MSATSRVWNRVLLFVAGAVLLLVGCAALAAGVVSAGNPPDWLRRAATRAVDAWGTAAAWTWEIEGIGTVPTIPLIAATVVVLLTVVLMIFVFTRGRGRSTTVLEVDSVDGRTTVDRNVVEALLTEPLIRRPDVLSARTGAYRVGKARAVELAITVRPGASLGAVVAAAEGVIAEWDQLLGARIPILLHLSDRRWRDALRSTMRAR